MDIGKVSRDVFLKGLEIGGTRCDAGGEQRKAVKSKQKSGLTTFLFADEFPLKLGDKIRERATESYFTVTEMEPVSAADSFLYFEVTTKRDS